MNKQAVQMQSDKGKGDYVIPGTIEYDPFSGAVMSGSRVKKFVPYYSNEKPPSKYPVGVSGPPLPKFQRTIFDQTPETLKRRPYKTLTPQGQPSLTLTDKLHERLFGLPASTESLYEDYINTAVRNNYRFHDARDSIAKPIEDAINIAKDYNILWQDDAEKSFPEIHQATGFARPFQFLRAPSDIPGYEAWLPKLEDVYVPLDDVDLKGKQDYYRQIQSSMENARDHLDSLLSEAKEMQKAYDMSPQGRWAANHSIRNSKSREDVLAQKRSLMQQYIDNSKVADLYRKYPSMYTAVPYFGYKALPYLWSENWSIPANKAFNDAKNWLTKMVDTAKRRQVVKKHWEDFREARRQAGRPIPDWLDE